jgi:hypothetical protein
MASYQDFVNRWNRLPLEVEDPSNRDQCMDLAFGWTDELGIPREAIRHLYAYQVFTEPNDVTRQFFYLIHNTPGGVPAPGDLVVWRPNGRFTGSAGHIDMALEGSDANHFRAFDQNWAGHSYCEILSHPYDDVIGWLHPKQTNQGDQEMVVDAALRKELYNVILVRDPEPDIGDAWIGQDFHTAFVQIANSPERVALLKTTSDQIASLREQITSQQTVIDALNIQVQGLQAQVEAAKTATPTVPQQPSTAPANQVGSSFDLARYQKTIIALIGGAVTVATAVFGPDNQVLVAVTTALTALGVFALPNKENSK